MVIKPYTGLYKGHNRLSREIYNKFGLRLTVGVAQFVSVSVERITQDETSRATVKRETIY